VVVIQKVVFLKDKDNKLRREDERKEKLCVITKDMHVL